MELKEKIVALRKEKGLTQLAVAEKLNVSRQAISRWESGTALPSTDNLRCLSSLYEVPIDYLLKEDSERKSNPDNEPAPDKFRHKNKKTVALIAATLVGILAIGILCYFLVRNNEKHIGLIDSAGVFHYVNVKNGSIDQTFKISESDTYRLGIRNNSGKTVKVSGFVRY